MIFQLILKNEIEIIIEYILNIFNNKNTFIVNFFIFKFHFFKIRDYYEFINFIN